jgi:hypothetical protein
VHVPPLSITAVHVLAAPPVGTVGALHPARQVGSEPTHAPSRHVREPHEAHTHGRLHERTQLVPLSVLAVQLPPFAFRTAGREEFKHGEPETKKGNEGRKE